MTTSFWYWGVIVGDPRKLECWSRTGRADCFTHCLGPGLAGPSGAGEVQAALEQSVRLNQGLSHLSPIGCKGSCWLEIPAKTPRAGEFGQFAVFSWLDICWNRYRLGTNIDYLGCTFESSRPTGPVVGGRGVSRPGKAGRDLRQSGVHFLKGRAEPSHHCHNWEVMISKTGLVDLERKQESWLVLSGFSVLKKAVRRVSRESKE